LIVIGLSSSRVETKKIHSFLNKQENIAVDYESDIKSFCWDHSENIIIKRIQYLENKIHNNTFRKKDQFKVFGEVCFYILPYLEILINNFPYLKFICTTKSKKKFKNHFIVHNGKKWEKDYMLDKCYPNFELDSLNGAIDKYIELYYSTVKNIEKKYPNNLKVFYSDELQSKYGKKKIFSFMGLE